MHKVTYARGDFATQKSPDRRPEWFITVTKSVFRFYPFLTPASSTDYPSRCLEIHAGAEVANIDRLPHHRPDPRPKKPYPTQRTTKRRNLSHEP